MNKKPTIGDVLDAVNTFATSVDKRFDNVDRRFERVETDIFGMKQDLNILKKEMVGVKTDIVNMRSDLMTEIDRFAVSNQRLDTEVISLRSRCDRIEGYKR